MVARLERRRELARQMARDCARPVRWGVDAATLAGSRAMRAALTAWRRRDPRLLEYVRRELMAAAPRLGQARTMAALIGLQRGRQLASLSLGFGDAIKVLERRLKIPREQLVDLGNRQEMAAVQMLDKAVDAVERELQEVMLKITMRGVHVKEGVETLRKATWKIAAKRMEAEGLKSMTAAFAKMGIHPDRSFQFEAIFRTQAQLAYSAGEWQAMQDPAVDEILWGYTYTTVGDDRVRDEHAELDGVTLPKDDPLWETIWPPNGWACRCVTIPVFEPEPIVRPPGAVQRDGRTIRPGADEGFRYHPGKVLGATIAA